MKVNFQKPTSCRDLCAESSQDYQTTYVICILLFFFLSDSVWVLDKECVILWMCFVIAVHMYNVKYIYLILPLL